MKIKKNYKGQIRYILKHECLSDLQFPNLYAKINSKDISNDTIEYQFNKVREEFYEMCAEHKNSVDFNKELLDLITASINLYYACNKSNTYYDKHDRYEIYNSHVRKINNRLLTDYDWKIPGFNKNNYIKGEYL